MRMMIVNICLFLSVSLVVAQDNKEGSDAQIKPDLSGTWTYPKLPLGQGRNKITDYVLTIVQRGDEIRMLKKYTEGGRAVVDEKVYYTDGRKAGNSQKNPKVPTFVVKWSGKKLVIQHKSDLGLSLVVVTTEEWVLSKDGNKLTRRLSSSGAIIGPSIKTSFVRTSK
jgi:hypothetical protein